MDRRSVSRVLSLPPGVILRKVGERAERTARRIRARIRGHLGASEAGFHRALRPEVLGRGGPRFFQRDKGEGPRFFFDPRKGGDLVARARELFPALERAVFSSAEDILAHRFDLLGSGRVTLGETIDWQKDFISGFRWEAAFYADVPAVDLSRTGVDVKVPWELSRFQHLPILGQAYWYSVRGGGRVNPARFSREFVVEVRDWVQKNPPGIGVNWSCTMDVAIRVVNWLWGYYFLCTSPSLTEDFHRLFFKALLDHGRHIRRNLERSGDLTGNHYLADIVGLVFLGVLVPELREAEEWRSFGARELEREMMSQVYPDGMDFEASISYHRLALEFFSTASLLLRINGTDLSAAFRERLEKMFESVLWYTRPDGFAPQVGDADDGRLQVLNGYPRWERRDHRYLLALGGRLFDRGDMAAAGRGAEEEAFFLLNGEIRRPEGAPGEPGSRAFPDSGVYVLRDRDRYLLCDCGGNGQRGRGGHAHNDTLSVEVFSGEPFLVDPGTYAYTSSERWRNAFRSTSFHNTIAVNGEEMNRLIPGEVFRLPEDAVPRVHRWESTAEWDLLDAEHTGYVRLTPPVIHRRMVYFNKTLGFWIVRDRLLPGEGAAPPTGKDRGADRRGRAAGAVTYEAFFHFDPRIRVRRVRPPLSIPRIKALLTMMRKTAGEAVDVVRPGPTVRADGSRRSLLLIPLSSRGLTLTVGSGWVSPRYGVRKRGAVAVFRKTEGCPAEFLTLILAPPRSRS